MAKESAGLVLYRHRNDRVEVLLVHPGGPYWAKKDAGAWSIPKGELDQGEDPLAAARREVAEETGLAPGGPFAALGTVRQSGGKQVHAFAAAADGDVAATHSNLFTLEWPPRSGRMQQFPEVDRAGWFDLATARRKINGGQAPLLDALEALLQD